MSATIETKKRANLVELQDSLPVELQISNINESHPFDDIQSNLDQDIDSIIGFVHIGNRLMTKSELTIPGIDLIGNINILIYNSIDVDSLFNSLESRDLFTNFQTLDTNNGVMVSSNLLNNSENFNLKISNSETQTIIPLNVTYTFDYNLKTSMKVAQLTNEEPSFLGQNDGIILISLNDYVSLLESALGITLQNEMFFYDIFLDRGGYSSLSTVNDIIDQLLTTTNQLYILNSLYFSNQGLINSVLLDELESQLNNYIIAETILILFVSPSLIFAGILLYFFNKIEENKNGQEILYWKYKGFNELAIKMSIQLASIMTILISIVIFFSGFFIFTISSENYDFSILISNKILFQLLISCSLLTIMILWLNNQTVENIQNYVKGTNLNSKAINDNKSNRTLTNIILLDIFLSLTIGSYYASSEISEEKINVILRFFLIQGLLLAKLTGIGLSVIIILVFFVFVSYNFDLIIKIENYVVQIFGIKYSFLILRKIRSDKLFLKLLVFFVFVGFFLVSIPYGLQTSIDGYLETDEKIGSTSDYVISITGINSTQLGQLPSFQEYQAIDNYYEATFFTGQSEWSWLGGQTQSLLLVELDVINYARFLSNEGRSKDLQSKIVKLDGRSNESISSWSMTQVGLSKGDDFVVSVELDSTLNGIETIIFNVNDTIDYILPGFGNKQLSDTTGYILVGNNYFSNYGDVFQTFSTFSIHNIYINFVQDIDASQILDQLVNDIVEKTDFKIEISPFGSNKGIDVYSGENVDLALPSILNNKKQDENLGSVKTYLIASELLSDVIPSFVIVFILFMNIYTYYSIKLNQNNINYLLFKGYSKSFVVFQFWLEQVVFILIAFFISILGIHIFVSTISYHSLSFEKPVLNWENKLGEIWIDILVRNFQLLFLLVINVLILSFSLVNNFKIKMGSHTRIQNVKR